MRAAEAGILQGPEWLEREFTVTGMQRRMGRAGEGLWEDCLGLQCEVVCIKFRVWTVFSKPQKDKEGSERCQSGCNINGGWEGGLTGGKESSRKEKAEPEGVMW